MYNTNNIKNLIMDNMGNIITLEVKELIKQKGVKDGFYTIYASEDLYYTEEDWKEIENIIKSNDLDNERVKGILSVESTPRGKEVFCKFISDGVIEMKDAIYSDIIMDTLWNGSYECGSNAYEITYELNNYENKEDVRKQIDTYVKEYLATGYDDFLGIVSVCKLFDNAVAQNEQLLNFVKLFEEATREMGNAVSIKENVCNDEVFKENMIYFIYDRMPKSLQTEDKEKCVKDYLDSVVL